MNIAVDSIVALIVALIVASTVELIIASAIDSDSDAAYASNHVLT
jgi:hypothetical protein